LCLPSIEKPFGGSLARSDKCFLVGLGRVHAYGTTKVNLGCVWAWNNKINHVIKKVDIGYVQPQNNKGWYRSCVGMK
jgi:hypothetical protein